jgi:hypothetical protein
MPMPRVAIARGSSCARTAYFCCPKIWTCATPDTVLSRCAMSVSANSFTCDSGSVGELTARYSTGWSAGFTLRYDGGLGMSAGSWRCACAIADCTS